MPKDGTLVPKDGTPSPTAGRGQAGKWALTNCPRTAPGGERQGPCHRFRASFRHFHDAKAPDGGEIGESGHLQTGLWHGGC